MRRKRIVQAGKCYHLVSRVAHKAFFFDDEEKDRFVDLLMRVEFFSCVKVLAYCCMSNHIHVFIFLEFGMFGSGKGKKAEREKEMQKAPSEPAEKYPMPPKYELALEEGNGEMAKRLLALLASGEKSRSELAAELGVSSQPWLSASYLNPLMKQGYIAQTLPQKPKSPLQRYRILRKGREVLA